MRGGVSASRVFMPPGPWRTLFEFLRERFPHVPEHILEARLARGDIVDSAGMAQRADKPYQAQGWLWYYREVPDEAAVPFELKVLYRDDALIAVDKPHFLASTPGGQYLRETALTRLREQLSMPEISPMHRLDRSTAATKYAQPRQGWKRQDYGLSRPSPSKPKAPAQPSATPTPRHAAKRACPALSHGSTACKPVAAAARKAGLR